MLLISVGTRFLTTQGWTIWFVESGFGNAGFWSSDDDLVMFPMQAHTKISLACIARPYINLVWKVGLLGLSLRRITFSPFFRFCWIPPFCLSSFSLLYKYFLPVPLPRVSFSFLWGRYSSYQSIRQSGWQKLDSMVWSIGLSGAGLHIMVLAVFSLVLLLYWVCPFLQAFSWDVGREVILDYILGPSRSFIARPRRLGFIG